MLLQRFRISTRILCASLVPMAAFTIFAVMQILSLKADADHYGATQSLIRQERVLSTAIHMLQKERGYSFAHVGSQGRDMGSELIAARKDTDLALAGIAETGATLNGFDAASFAGAVETMSAQLQKLAGMRDRIDALDLTAGEAGGYYTATIAAILNTSREMTGLLGDPELSREFDAYLDAVTAKELAGQERGLGAAAIGANRFQDGGFGRFVDLMGGQSFLMERFLSAVEGDTGAQVREIYGEGLPRELASMRQSLIMGGVNGMVFGLDGKHWFDTATAWIERLNKVALVASEDIKSRAALGEERASSSLRFTAAALVLATLGMAVFLVFLVRSINGPLKGLSSILKGMAAGNLDADITYASQSNELGDMARSVLDLKEAIRRRVEEEAAVQARRAEDDARRSEEEAERIKRQAESTRFAVGELGGGLNRLADGDVTYRIEHHFVDTLDALRENYNVSMDRLQETLASVQDGVRNIDAGVREIRVASDDLAGRTEQQAASVEETAAAIEEITTAVKDSAARAAEVGRIVGKATQAAEKSGDVVRQAVESIGRIAASSKEIEQIIAVIDDIAFQTNLLALNAGVEAARAGEAGSGFGVVAGEVRELAQRSARSAKEIQALIQSSASEVKDGVDLVNRTGEALSGIIEEVQQVNAHVSAIAAAAAQQSTSLAEVSIAVSSIDHSTQTNAAMVEQTTAATHGLEKEAGTLSRLVAQFQVGAAGYGAADQRGMHRRNEGQAAAA
ncbi:methyl-accepting chemotaxis protein [Zhengella mangrovi]|nr:methyl-accepting chemotaxis protein [Zhengella mangrovi]